MKDFLRSLRPVYLGIACVHMWIYCATHRPSATSEVPVMVVLYTALSAALIVLFWAVRRFRGRGERPRAERAVDLAAALAMAFGGAALALSNVPPALVAAGAALGGVGVGWAYARWTLFYARLDIHYAAPLVFLSMALGSAGKAVIDFLPELPAALVLAALPFVTFGCVRSALARAPQAPEPVRYYTRRTVGSLARLAGGIAVYSLTIGIVQAVLLGSLPSWAHPSVLVHHGTEVLIALAVVAWVAVLKRGLDFNRSWRLILVLMATTLLFEPYLDPNALSYLVSLVRTAQTFLIVLLFLALADVARHSPYRPEAVFAAGWVAYALPFDIGNAAGSALAATSSGTGFTLSAIVWVLVMVMLFVLDDAATGNKLIFAELNDGGGDDTPAQRAAAVQRDLDGPAAGGDAPQAGEVDRLALRCRALADAYGLTPREHEILELLVRGRSKVHIAEAFLISENTVRGHVKHIYAKLDVHGKQELLDKLEAVPAGRGR
jgi:DNA-binding CsgD family transcriptional regulator